MSSLQEKADREFRERQEALKRADEERVAKNREKRLKKKNKKKTKGSKPAATNGTTGSSSKNAKKSEGAGSEDSSDSSDEEDEEGEPSRKKLKLRSGAPGVVFRGADEREQDDDQPREEEIKVKRIEEALKNPPASEQNTDSTAAQPQGLVIVDED